MKELFYATCIGFTFAWIMANTIALTVGIVDGHAYPSKCEQLRRYELIVPGHIIGCYLIQPLSE